MRKKRMPMGALLRRVTPMIAGGTLYAVVLTDRRGQVLAQLYSDTYGHGYPGRACLWLAKSDVDWEIVDRLNNDSSLAFEACVMAEEYDAAARLAVDEYRTRGLL